MYSTLQAPIAGAMICNVVVIHITFVQPREATEAHCFFTPNPLMVWVVWIQMDDLPCEVGYHVFFFFIHPI